MVCWERIVLVIDHLIGLLYFILLHYLTATLASTSNSCSIKIGEASNIEQLQLLSTLMSVWLDLARSFQAK